MKTVKVAAAVICDNFENITKIFATARGQGEYRGFWEFPGGKLEPGETAEQALAREIREELDTEICVRRSAGSVEYDYPGFHLSMECFWCTVERGELTLKEAEASRWLGWDELDSVDWLPADLEIVKQLRSRTQLKPHYNTVIIGAGPAGLACALTLLEKGVTDVLVAEKHRFPRDKCCAGYITRKTEKVYKRFGLDPEECGYSCIKDFGLFYRRSMKQRIDNRFLLTSRGINRVELDDAFFRLASARGVQVAEAMPITGHDPDKHTVVLGSRFTVGYDNLVFADGTSGFGSRYQQKKKCNLAMQLLFKTDRPDSIEIHFGVSPRGYCWISSFKGLTNVGMTDEYRHGRTYRQQFEKFLADNGFSPDTGALYAAFTPIGVRKPVINGNIYFAGDAMGACDPFTLSGLRYGLASGEKAGLAIAANDPRILKRFAGNLSVRFFFSRLIMKLFYVGWINWLVFNVGSRFLSGAVAFFFNRFLNKK